MSLKLNCDHWSYYICKDSKFKVGFKDFFPPPQENVLVHLCQQRPALYQIFYQYRMDKYSTIPTDNDAWNIYWMNYA